MQFLDIIEWLFRKCLLSLWKRWI